MSSKIFHSKKFGAMSNFRARKGDDFFESDICQEATVCSGSSERQKNHQSHRSPSTACRLFMAPYGQDSELVGTWGWGMADAVIISENPDSNLLKQATQRNGARIARIGHFPEMDSSTAFLWVALHMNSLKNQRVMEGQSAKVIRSWKLKNMMEKKFENLRFNRGSGGIGAI